MSASTALIAFVATVVFFFAIDMVWLAKVARGFYAEQLGDLMAENVHWGVALAFYTLYCVGIVIFAVRPGLTANSALTAVMWGALFGFFCYATYDLTNLATTRDWPAKMVIVDIIWGTVLTGTVAGLATWVTLFFTRA
ncbi:DUF2177 family protein [Litorimonas sp. RW-G-Af-16]|uniref:DUF2177 family protein n=1 Tax=Litorimonas sp. RW-G-Af-16 TaxID=3241168 RepID=UPI00390C9CFB